MKRVLISILFVLSLLSFSCVKKDTKIVENSKPNTNKVKDDASNLINEIEDDDNAVYDLEEGMIMPNVKVETNKGSVFELKKASKPVLINFWATWCSPCRMEMPGLQSLYEEFGDKIDFVMINLGESKETIQDFMVENELYTFPIGYDTQSTYGSKFSIVGIPTTYIIDEDKILRNYVVGARSEKQFREYLEELIY